MKGGGAYQSLRFPSVKWDGAGVSEHGDCRKTGLGTVAIAPKGSIKEWGFCALYRALVR
jgi:hypothetical protein